MQWMEGSRPRISGAETNTKILRHMAWCIARAHSVLRGSVDILCSWGSIGCALALKFCGGSKTDLNFKTQKVFGEISVGVQVIQIINYFNGFPKSTLRKIK